MRVFVNLASVFHLASKHIETFVRIGVWDGMGWGGTGKRWKERVREVEWVGGWVGEYVYVYVCVKV